MRFGTFWNLVKRELTQDTPLQTIKQHKGFSARFEQGEVIIFPQSSMHQRNISQEEFLHVWNQAKNYNREQQFVRQNYNEITRNGSYILAIFNHFLREGDIE